VLPRSYFAAMRHERKGIIYPFRPLSSLSTTRSSCVSQRQKSAIIFIRLFPQVQHLEANCFAVEDEKFTANVLKLIKNANFY